MSIDAGRLVEEQQLRRADQRAGEDQQRALAARQARSALADRKVETGGVARQEDVGARAHHRVDQLVVVGLGRAEHQIVAHRAAEQFGVLADEAERLAQLVRVVLAAVEAVDQHLAVGRRVEPAQQRGRASTCPTRPGR